MDLVIAIPEAFVYACVCTQCDVSYVLYIKGLSQALHQRAVRKGLGLPWWTGGERYTEINRAAGND